MTQTKESIAAREKQYYEADKEAIATYKKKYYEANKEAKIAYNKADKEAIAARESSIMQPTKNPWLHIIRSIMKITKKL